MRHWIKGTFWCNCLVAAGYFLLAAGGRMLALPPGYASPIWPAAGWALAALLLCGSRCWSGVLVGSFLFNAWLQFSSTAGVDWFVTGLISAGAMLQALCGAVLTRRILQAAAPLAQRGHAFLFLLWGGPVACLLSSTLGIAGLYVTGHLAATHLFAQWLAWWSGDTVGVLLFAPLVFAVLPAAHAANGLRPAQVAVPMLLVAALVVVALLWLDRSEAANYALHAEQAVWETGMSARAQLLHAVSVLFTFAVVLSVLASAGYSAAVNLETEQRKKAEEALSDSEAILEETSRLTNVGGWQLEVATGTLCWTPGLYRIVEAPHDLPLARGTSMNFIRADAHDQMNAAMHALLTVGAPFDFDVPFVSAKGRRGWVHIVGQAEWRDGCIVRVHGAVQDITERVNMEQRANHAQRLQAIGTMAGGIAHDLNNALAPIVLLMDLLREEYPGRTGYIDLIEKSALHAADMAKQLLMFAKGVEGKKVALQPQLLLQEMDALLKGTFPRNIEMRVHSEDDLPALLGYKTQLHQILLNLCVNARDAMPEGGTLTLEATTQAFTNTVGNFVLEARPGRYVVFRVSDTGAGIAADIQARIFDPFFTTKSAEKGSGFGLSTVLGIVKNHGGFMQVESEIGSGSVFSIYMPIMACGAAEAVKVPLSFSGEGMCVLVVDDEPAVRQLAAAVLQQLRFDVLLAVDGADALRVVSDNHQRLSLVITDMHMPNMDGLVFVRELRKVMPDLPVIVASGLLEDAVATELAGMGVSLRMDKPFTRETVIALLQAALADKNKTLGHAA